MADFFKFLPTLLEFEGGYVDDPDDPGGATNRGVTYPLFHEVSRPLLDISPSLQALKQLSPDHAGRIYKAEFWDRLYADQIPFQPMADIMFDFYVNAGDHAVHLYYKVLNSLGGRHNVVAWMEEDAIRALQHHNVKQVYMAYKHGRIAYYRALAHEHPVLRRFLKGWLNRVNAFPNFATGVAHEDNVCQPPKAEL